jgi:hypothetical protein
VAFLVFVVHFWLSVLGSLTAIVSFGDRWPTEIIEPICGASQPPRRARASSPRPTACASYARAIAVMAPIAEPSICSPVKWQFAIDVDGAALVC